MLTAPWATCKNADLISSHRRASGGKRILLLAPDAFDPNHREVLFVRQPNEHLAIWEGHKLAREEAAAISGIKNVKWLTDFPGMFRQVICEMQNVYLNTNEHQRADVTVETRDVRFVHDCLRRFPACFHHRAVVQTSPLIKSSPG